MSNKIPNIKKLLTLVMLLSGILLKSGNATIIMVYSTDTASTFDSLKSISKLLNENLKDSTLQIPRMPDGQTWYVIAESSFVLNGKFSVPRGALAYGWANGSVQVDPSFKMLGRLSFENVGSDSDLTPLAKTAMAGKGGNSVIFTTFLTGALVSNHSLHVAYSLSKAEAVSLQIFGISGQSFGKWSWQNASAGAYVRDLPLSNIQRTGILFVRWNSGNISVIQKVLANGMGQ